MSVEAQYAGPQRRILSKEELAQKLLCLQYDQQTILYYRLAHGLPPPTEEQTRASYQWYMGKILTTARRRMSEQEWIAGVLQAGMTVHEANDHLSAWQANPTGCAPRYPHQMKWLQSIAHRMWGAAARGHSTVLPASEQ